jgi:hypothetical protein
MPKIIVLLYHHHKFLDLWVQLFAGKARKTVHLMSGCMDFNITCICLTLMVRELKYLESYYSACEIPYLLMHEAFKP